MSVNYVIGEAQRIFRQRRREFIAALATRLEDLGARVVLLRLGTQVA